MKTASWLVLFVIFSLSAFAQDPAPGTPEFKAILDQSKRDALTLFPDSGVKGTPLYNALAAEVLDTQNNDPTYFNNPAWPVTILRKVIAANPSLVAATPPTPDAPPAATPQPTDTPAAVQTEPAAPTLKDYKLVLVTREPESAVTSGDWRVGEGEIYILDTYSESRCVIRLNDRTFEVPTECLTGTTGADAREKYQTEGYDMAHPITGRSEAIYLRYDLTYVVDGKKIVAAAGHSYVSAGEVDGDYVLIYHTTRLYVKREQARGITATDFPSPGALGDQPANPDLVEDYNNWKQDQRDAQQNAAIQRAIDQQPFNKGF